MHTQTHVYAHVHAQASASVGRQIRGEEKAQTDSKISCSHSAPLCRSTVTVVDVVVVVIASASAFKPELLKFRHIQASV